MNRDTDKYAQFVDHPRYGRRPNITGLNPRPMDRGVRLHWNATTLNEMAGEYKSATGEDWPYGDLNEFFARSTRIPNTAVAADLTRQTPATVAVTHYFDLERVCCDCGRAFIFFAEEQKHWYEQLGFGLESDCVRCVECRKHRQGIGRQRNQYETLFHIENKTDEQTLAMAEACLTLIENHIFTNRQIERVRMLLNTISEDAEVRTQPRYADLVSRVAAAEAGNAPDRPSLDGADSA